jgi:Sortase domain
VILDDGGRLGVTAWGSTAEPGSRRRDGGGALLAVLALYGLALAATGVLGAIGAIGFGGAVASTSASLGEGGLGRPVQTAPLLPPGNATASGPATSPGVLPAASLPAASAGTDIPARPAVFVPARVVLPDGTSAPVVPVGLHDDGSLVIPDDVRTVGWWTGGSKAGEAYGSVVIAGHVDSAIRGIGVFAQLRHLSPGQVVGLVAGAQQARYRIISATQVPQAQISQDAGIFAVDGDPRLVLITCGGPFDPVRHRYQDNLVVVATPLT